MNEKLNLIEILKDCPEGTKLYSPIYGDVELVEVRHDRRNYPIEARLSDNMLERFTEDGRIFIDFDGECMLFPSREERDWSKFKPTQIKKPKFDPQTLQPFDRVLIRDSKYEDWRCNIFSHIYNRGDYPFRTTNAYYAYCIPYNDDTKHLVGTKEEAPEFYRY